MMWMYNSDHSDSDNFGDESETSYVIVCTIVNKSSCPKCQGEYLKGHVANVADLFNASI